MDLENFKIYLAHLLDEISSNPRSFQCILSTSAAITSKHTQVMSSKLEIISFGENTYFLIKFVKTENFQYTCVCLLVVAAEVYDIHWKLLGFEEISSRRWARYILKFSRSNSKKIYDLGSAAMKTDVFYIISIFA